MKIQQTVFNYSSPPLLDLGPKVCIMYVTLVSRRPAARADGPAIAWRPSSANRGSTKAYVSYFDFIPANMSIHLVNPSDTSFGTAVITPRWLYVLAAATAKSFGDPLICDETLNRLDPSSVHAGDVAGIGI